MRQYVFCFDNSELVMDEREGIEHVLSVAVAAPDLSTACVGVAACLHKLLPAVYSNDPDDYRAGVDDGSITLLLPHTFQWFDFSDEVAPKTYMIIRHYKDINKDKETIETGLTLAEAQAHCSDPSTSNSDWFDGFEEEG